MSRAQAHASAVTRGRKGACAARPASWTRPSWVPALLLRVFVPVNMDQCIGMAVSNAML